MSFYESMLRDSVTELANNSLEMFRRHIEMGLYDHEKLGFDGAYSNQMRENFLLLMASDLILDGVSNLTLPTERLDQRQRRKAPEPFNAKMFLELGQNWVEQRIGSVVSPIELTEILPFDENRLAFQEVLDYAQERNLLHTILYDMRYDGPEDRFDFQDYYFGEIIGLQRHFPYFTAKVFCLCPTHDAVSHLYQQYREVITNEYSEYGDQILRRARGLTLTMLPPK